MPKGEEVIQTGYCDGAEKNKTAQQQLVLTFNKTWTITFDISSDKM